MAPKKRPHKRNKRSLKIREGIAKRKAVLAFQRPPLQGTFNKETSDSLFNQLISDSGNCNHDESDSTDDDIVNDPDFLPSPTGNSQEPPDIQRQESDNNKSLLPAFEPDVQYTNLECEDNDESEDYLPLVIEKEEPQACTLLQGRRIVDVNHVLQQLEIVASHPRRCTMGKFKLKKETRNGLYSTWIYFCDNCDKDFVVTSEPISDKADLNDAAAWGAMSVGVGYSQLDELLSVLNVPFMGHKKYKVHEEKVGNAWEEILAKKMKDNAEEEKQIAIQKGNFHQGIPYITVIGDACWAKRSYGHGMNSLSGAGAIIGAETKKLLFLGVRNKFCFACAYKKTKRENHICFKNYTGSSTGMESNVILEGFRRSQEDYGLVYRDYIGDGDSSVFARIQEGCSYGRFVRKIECANHVTRALSDNLHTLAGNTLYPLESRQILNKPAPSETISRLERIVKGVRTAIKEARRTKSSEDVLNLRKALKNAPDHVFGVHDRCGEFCKRKLSEEENLLSQLDKDFLVKIRTIIGNVESKADSLVYNETTNIAEKYMGCVAKFTGGKRVNFSSSGSFRRRCIGAGLAHSVGPSWHLSPWKKFKSRSPGTVFKQRLIMKQKRHMKRKLTFSTKPAKRKRRDGGYDTEYGPLAVEADVDDEELAERCKNIMDSLALEVADGNEIIERQTVGQHKNQAWVEKRINRLTASRFGAVIKRLPHTSCHNLVKSILYPKSLNSESVTFGRDNEETVRQLYVEKTGNDVSDCGLFVDTIRPYLGASPDGIVRDKGILEIKCLPSIKDSDLRQEASCKKKNLCLEVIGDTLRLKRTHLYYFQVQGQLNICGREWCDFAVYTRRGELFIERIVKDNEFWNNKMVPKLVAFYQDCMLPEIVDSRIVRGMKVRDPQYIIEAQREMQEKKGRKKEKREKKRE